MTGDKLTLPSTVQPPEGSGLGEYRTEIIPGRRYRFELTGTVVTAGRAELGRGLHICSGADLEIISDSGHPHYLHKDSTGLRAAEAVRGWPPLPGDLWRDTRGALWFCRKNPSCKVTELVSTTGEATLAHTSQVLFWALEHRDEGEVAL